jgi:two-component system, NtrC family, sensor histidine kinase HydH
MFKSSLQNRRGIFPSPWIIIAAAAILLLVVVTLAVRNINREKQHMSQILSEKGAALIKAFEAGARTGMMGMMWSGNQVQRLLEETAHQPDIVYLMVVDRNGRILAHNDRSRIGKVLKALPVAEKSERWRLTELQDGQQAFEVFRIFKPLQGGGRGTHHGKGQRRQAMICPPGAQGQNAGDWCFPADPEKSEQIIFAGFDMTPFEAARQEDIRNTLVISGVLALLGIAGFISIFWAHHYQSAKRSLQDASAFAREVVTSLPVGLIATDRAGRIAFFNAAAEKITGISLRQARGRLPEDVLPAHWCGLREAMTQGKKVIEQEMECAFGSDRSVPVSLSASRIINEDDAFVGHVIILRDLGEIRQLQEEIRRTEKLAALGGLAAGVAHEIRNPLSSIKGMASYFGSKFPEGSQDREAARVMTDEVDRLNRVISELLDFARPSELTRQPTDIPMLLSHSLKLIAPDAVAKNITIKQEINIDPDRRPVIDADRFSQCLLNLYLNAIQAMPAGGQMQVRAWTTGDGAIHFTISDSGKGIPEAQQQQIFDPYYTTKPKGTGLGLAIVHKIVTSHDGRISVQSRPGEGARFHITLPPETTGDSPPENFSMGKGT